MLQNPTQSMSDSRNRRWSELNPPPTSPRTSRGKSVVSLDGQPGRMDKMRSPTSPLAGAPMSPTLLSPPPMSPTSGKARRWSLVSMLTSPFRTGRNPNRRRSSDMKPAEMMVPTSPLVGPPSTLPSRSSRGSIMMSPMLRVKSRKTFNPLYRKSVKGAPLLDKAPKPPPRPSLKYKNKPKANAKSIKGRKSFKSFKKPQAPTEPVQARTIIPPSKEVLDMLDEINALPSTAELTSQSDFDTAFLTSTGKAPPNRQQRTAAQRNVLRQPTGRWKGKQDVTGSKMNNPTHSDDGGGGGGIHTTTNQDDSSSYEQDDNEMASSSESRPKGFDRAKSVRLANRPLPTAPAPTKRQSRNQRRRKSNNAKAASAQAQAHGGKKGSKGKRRSASVKYVDRGDRGGNGDHGDGGEGGDGGDGGSGRAGPNTSGSVRGLTLLSSYPEDVAQQKPHGSSNGCAKGRGLNGRNARSMKGRQSIKGRPTQSKSFKGRPQSFKGGRPPPSVRNATAAATATSEQHNNNDNNTNNYNDDDDNSDIDTGATKLEFLPSKNNTLKTATTTTTPPTTTPPTTTTSGQHEHVRRTANLLDNRQISTASSTDEDFFADREAAISQRRKKEKGKRQAHQQLPPSPKLVLTLNDEEEDDNDDDDDDKDGYTAHPSRVLTLNLTRTPSNGEGRNHRLEHVSLTSETDDKVLAETNASSDTPLEKTQKPSRKGTGRWQGKGGKQGHNNKKNKKSNKNKSNNNDDDDDDGNGNDSSTVPAPVPHITRKRAGTGKFATDSKTKGHQQQVQLQKQRKQQQQQSQQPPLPLPNDDDPAPTEKKEICRKRAGTGRFGQGAKSNNKPGKTSKRAAAKQAHNTAEDDHGVSDDDDDADGHALLSPADALHKRVLESSLILADEAWRELAEYRELEDGDIAHDSQVNVDEGDINQIPSWRAEQITMKKEEELAGMTNPQRIRYLRQLRKQKAQQSQIEKLICEPVSPTDVDSEDHCQA